MALDGSGTFNRLYDWTDDRDAGVKIRADRMDAEMDGMATALSAALYKDGQQTPTADLPMGGFKHTNVANAAAANQYATLGQLQNNTAQWADAGGTVDAITATYTPTVTALTNGMILGVRASGANTLTTPTFAPDGQTARTIVMLGGSALLVGSIAADGHELLLRYDSANTRWELLNPAVTLTTLGAPSLTTVNTFSKTQSWSKGADVASASPLVLGTDGNFFDVTGTTGFSAITVAAGTLFALQFDGVLTLTHGASLDLPSEANITTAAGDRLIGFAEAANTVQVLAYTRADGTPISGGLTQASQAAIVAETNEDTYAPPDLLRHSPGVAKLWIVFGPDAVADDSYNVASITDNGAGDWTIVVEDDFATVNYVVLLTFDIDSLSTANEIKADALAVGSFNIDIFNPGAGTNNETSVGFVFAAAFGTQV